MHTATQILAQRAPPASRSTKAARWQPYLQSTTTSQLPRSPTIHIPHASVSSPAQQPTTHLISAESSRSRLSNLSATAQTPKDSSQGASSSKQKFASSLIDQAVSTLSEIWRPQDIPSVFLPPAKAGGCSFPSSTHPHPPPKQLSSDLQSIASHTHPTQPHPASGHNPSPTLALLASGTESDQILPLKSFVHEVLRRSRTSGNVLQTALCYLEAIRPKVPQILQEENIGIRSYYQPESCIQKATPEELAMDAELSALEDAGQITIINDFVDDSMKTVRVTDSGPEDLPDSYIYPEDSLSSVVVEPSNASTVPPSSMPSLPSPLLCPRRAFLASLILASKFSQDKCYSNRAWAKLSGLPPREIGRCERALGQALQWRLWVGKCAFGSQSESTATVTPSRPVIRSQTEPSLMPTSTSEPFLSEDESSVSQPISLSSNLSEKVAAGRPHVGIRRALSLPLESTFPLSSRSSVGVSLLQSDSETNQQDQVMGRPPVSDHSVSSSPSPPTPTLTYSPLSTDSSGDRTVQVTAMDDVYSSSSCNGSQPWTGLVVDTSCDNGNISFGGGLCRLDGQDFARQLAMLQSLPTPVAVVETDVATYGANYMWSADSRYILEATEVH